MNPSDDIRGAPQCTEPSGKCGAGSVGHLRLPTNPAQMTGPAPSHQPAARGAWMIPLLGRSALQLVENQLAMLLEYAQRLFERMEHRLSNLRGVARI